MRRRERGAGVHALREPKQRLDTKATEPLEPEPAGETEGQQAGIVDSPVQVLPYAAGEAVQILHGLQEVQQDVPQAVNCVPARGHCVPLDCPLVQSHAPAEVKANSHSGSARVVHLRGCLARPQHEHAVRVAAIQLAVRKVRLVVPNEALPATAGVLNEVGRIGFLNPSLRERLIQRLGPLDYLLRLQPPRDLHGLHLEPLTPKLLGELVGVVTDAQAEVRGELDVLLRAVLHPDRHPARPGGAARRDRGRQRRGAHGAVAGGAGRVRLRGGWPQGDRGRREPGAAELPGGAGDGAREGARGHARSHAVPGRVAAPVPPAAAPAEDDRARRCGLDSADAADDAAARAWGQRVWELAPARPRGRAQPPRLLRRVHVRPADEPHPAGRGPQAVLGAGRLRRARRPHRAPQRAGAHARERHALRTVLRLLVPRRRPTGGGGSNPAGDPGARAAHERPRRPPEEAARVPSGAGAQAGRRQRRGRGHGQPGRHRRRRHGRRRQLPR
mmetsp:Transcript_98283/g.278222  ORF Transcript_98283/g.278222 Transcript_98283/m.278222 type:complete len:501 (+) Transcript_98283:335-1837(+)